MALGSLLLFLGLLIVVSLIVAKPLFDEKASDLHHHDQVSRWLAERERILDALAELDADWQIGYKRQMEIYQWLFRKNGFQVSNVGYFVYVNAHTDRKAFDGKLEFDVKIIPYEGSDVWIESALLEARKTLEADTLPEANMDCDFCLYRKSVQDALAPFQKKE